MKHEATVVSGGDARVSPSAIATKCVEVIKPITVIAIERAEKGEDETPTAVRVKVEYSFRDPGGNTNSSHSPLEAYANLGVNEGLLEKFIASGTAPEIATALNDLGNDPEQEPVVLRNGTLAELLRHGITPLEVWVFLLNRGGAKATSRLMINQQSEVCELRNHDHFLTSRQEQERLKRAMNLCQRTAKALAKVQRINLAPWVGPIRPLAPMATNLLIMDLALTARNLAAYRTALRRPARRPADWMKASFRSDWCTLAQGRASQHLHQQGAALFALVFGGEPKVRSFKTLCARARATKVRATK